MTLSVKSKAQIDLLIEQVVTKYLNKAKDNPKANSGNPFVMALLKDFEPLLHRIHGLKTSIGNEIEKIAEIIAIDSWGANNVKRKINVNVMLPKNVFQKIDTIINSLSNAQTLSDYHREKTLILNACKNPSNEKEQHTYEFDLLLKDNKNHIYILEMKGPDPNTTEVPGAKKRLLVAFAWSYFEFKTDSIDARLAIYYNNKHPKAYKNPKVHYYFNPDGGTIVQDDFWNFLGRNDSTYSDLISLFEDYGNRNKKRIWDGFSKLIEIDSENSDMKII